MYVCVISGLYLVHNDSKNIISQSPVTAFSMFEYYSMYVLEMLNRCQDDPY